MKKFFIFTLAIGLCSTMAIGAPQKRLASVLEVRNGEIPTDPLDKLMMSKRFFYNEQGELCKIIEGNKTITLEHDETDQKKMTMTVDDTSHGIFRIYDITLDDAGNAVAASCVSDDWKCDIVYEYADGYLTFMDKKTTESDRSVSETSSYEYADGSLSYIQMIHADGSTGFPDNVHFSYSGTSNAGNLHMFYTMMEAYVDEIEYLGQAGCLGNTCRELPSNVDMMLADGVRAFEADGSSGDYGDNLEWTFDDDGYPVRLNYVWNKDFCRIFTWEENTAMGVETTAVSGSECYYNLQGVRVDSPRKGIYIVVSPSGSKKILVK